MIIFTVLSTVLLIILVLCKNSPLNAFSYQLLTVDGSGIDLS